MDRLILRRWISSILEIMSVCESNNSKTTAATQIAILVCSNLAPQICKLATNLTRQEFRSLKQVIANVLDTTSRTCRMLVATNSLQTVAKTEYEHNLGFDPTTQRFLNMLP
ncbi:hypothetical protein AVEN_176069-1 [Araneus ventricosus]|uniref:Uncharacterized protein n=1 Tax=Araneus ventricosus TaxID=182803 RepID=A0A4Y2F7G1_ARAVE|nr:hypothetical protein AVEN_176069-1 [Araneus ventricosus]